MKSFLFGFGSTMKTLQAALIAYGALGILVIGFMDAASIPLPGGPDVAVMLLSHRSHAMMPLYVAAAVIGSTIGSLILYFAARKGGVAVLRKFSPERRAHVEGLIERYDILAMLLASVLPPPFPFKLFVLTAGAFEMKLWRFVLALVLGRGFRFLLEGWMAVQYGEQAADLFKHHYPRIGLGVAAAVLVIYFFNTLLKKRRREATS
jgi:membrane protein YqaA with SNARE-associated domain